MEQFDGKIYKMYTALEKRKRLDDEQAREQKANFRKYHDATMALIKDLEAKNEGLRQKMLDMLDEQKINKENCLEKIRAKDEEVSRLNLLLAEKDIVNTSALESLNRNFEIVPQSRSLTPIGKKTQQTNSKAKRVQLSSSPGEESREIECSKSHTCATGNGKDESSSAHMFHMLLESLVCLKISFNKGTEGFSFSACHEDTGYSFTLTWSEQHNEWRYKVSSLGTLESVAKDWMKQDIKFGMDMCPLFFQRISDVIR